MDKINFILNPTRKNNPRLVRFPYKFTDQIMLFPYKYYFKNVWMFRYWCYATIACMPVFYWITKQVQSPENVAKWKKIRHDELLVTHYLDDPDKVGHGHH